MKNQVQTGENITVTAAAAATSGSGVLIGSFFGVAAGDASIGDDLDLMTVGAFTGTMPPAWSPPTTIPRPTRPLASL